MNQQDRQEAAAELLALGTSIDEDLNEYMHMITEWTLRVGKKHNLTPRAQAMLLETAPSAADCFKADMLDRLMRGR